MGLLSRESQSNNMLIGLHSILGRKKRQRLDLNKCEHQIEETKIDYFINLIFYLLLFIWFSFVQTVHTGDCLENDCDVVEM